MGIVHLLCDLPNIAIFVCPLYQLEIGFGNYINDLICGKKVPCIKIDPTFSLPNDYLSNGEAFYDFRTILQKTSLDSPFVIVENGSVLRNKSEHLPQTIPLPFAVFVIWHVVSMLLTSIDQRSVFPLSAPAVFHAVPCGVLQVIRWRRNDKIDRPCW